MFKRVSFYMLVLLILLTIGLYAGTVMLTGSFFPWQKDNSLIQREIRIGFLSVEDSLPILLAQEKGYFAKKDLAVRLINFSNALDLNKAVADKRIDGQIGDLIGAAQLEQEGAPIKILTLCLGEKRDQGRFVLLSAPDSGIKQLKDLADVPVALANNSLSEYVADQLLAKELPNSQRKQVFIRPLSVRMKMLLTGKIKAAVLPEPLASSAINYGAIKIADDSKESNLSQSYLVFRSDLISQHSKDIKKFLEAYTQAVKDINSNPAEGKAILVKKGIIPSNIAASYQINQFPLPQAPNKEIVGKILSWMQQRGMVSSEISYTKLVEEKFVSRKKIFDFGEK